MMNDSALQMLARSVARRESLEHENLGYAQNIPATFRVHAALSSEGTTSVTFYFAEFQINYLYSFECIHTRCTVFIV